MKKAITYIRTSGETLRSNKGFGLEDQKTDCETYAAENGYEIIKTFCDNGVAGTDEALEKSYALIDLLSTEWPSKIYKKS